jgi:hypothetical protein
LRQPLNVYGRLAYQPLSQSPFAHFQLRSFTSSTDGTPPSKPDEKVKTPRTRAKKTVQPPELDPNGEIVPKTKRARKQKSEPTADTETPKSLRKMYVLKFNSPILPFAKFPLTQNKYITEFLKMYEQDKHTVEHVLGVHFPQNDNSLAKDTVGIEITITKKNNLTVIESVSSARYRVDSYD